MLNSLQEKTAGIDRLKQQLIPASATYINPEEMQLISFLYAELTNNYVTNNNLIASSILCKNCGSEGRYLKGEK